MEFDFLYQMVETIHWPVLLKLSIVGVIILIAKKYYDNISSYFMFRANKDLGRNVKIILNGRPGHITYYTWRFIYIRLSDTGNELIIPITKWTSYSWEICKNGNLGNDINCK